MKLAIIAGGKGTRLGLGNIPKPMATVDDKPVLLHQILLAKRFGITEIFILSGHLSEVIIDYFKDGARFGVKIHHIVEPQPLGTAGAVNLLKSIIRERFLVFFGDVFISMNLSRFLEFDRAAESIATLLVHPNDHPYDSDLLEVDEKNDIVAFHSKPHPEHFSYRNQVNAGVCILSPRIFDFIPGDKPSDFGRDIFPLLVKSGEKMRAYSSPEYVKDMGTIDRLEKVRRDYGSGKIARLNRENRQRAIFLDRDGVINEEVGNLADIQQFKLIDGVIEAIKNINHSEFLCIVITNQPVIAKGFCTEHELGLIHKKMETLLGNERAYIDGLYYCPHHPDKGFPGEVEALKVDCECRKPKPGLILKAAEDFNIDLAPSFFIGDRYADVRAGKNAGVKTILLNTGHAGKDQASFQITADYQFDSLGEAVTHIVEGTLPPNHSD